MAHYEDLSPYEYFLRQDTENSLNVGWLSASSTFQRSPPSPKLLRNLWQFCRVSVRPSRGVHKCELCSSDDAKNALFAEYEGDKLLLGFSEIRVFTASATFAAPTLVFHYVRDHHYLPPQAFVDGILFGPLPSEERYKALLSSLCVENRSTSTWVTKQIIAGS